MLLKVALGKQVLLSVVFMAFCFGMVLRDQICVAKLCTQEKVDFEKHMCSAQ